MIALKHHCNVKKTLYTMQFSDIKKKIISELHEEARRR